MVHPTCVSMATLRSQRTGDTANMKDVTNSLSSCPSIKLLSRHDQAIKPTGNAQLKYFPKVADFGDIIAFLSRQSYLPELSKTGTKDIEIIPKKTKPVPLERQKKRKEDKEKVCEENIETKVNSPCTRVTNIDNRDAEKNLGKESEEEVKTVELKTIDTNTTGVTPPPFKFTDLLDITKSRRIQRYQNRTKPTESPDKNRGPVEGQNSPQYTSRTKPIMIETSFLDNSPYIIPEKKPEKEKLPFDDNKDGPLIIPLDSEKAKLFESLNSYTPQVPFIPPPPLWGMVSTHPRQPMIDPPSYSPPSSPPPFYQPPSPEYTNPPPPLEFDENRFRSNTLTYLHEVKDYLTMTKKRNQVKQKLYHLQLEAPKPRLIPCQSIGVYGPPHYGDEFHGAISREEADRLLTNGGEGSYLVRESQRARGSYTLGLRLLGATKNFRLYFDGQHYVADKRFDTVHDLVADGLITMYVETKAADYIGRIEFEEPIYDKYSKQATFMRPQVGSNGSTPLSMPPDSPPGPPIGHQMVDGRNLKPTQGPITVEKDHVFKVHTFVGLNWCMFCGNFLWGLKSQGVKCTDCGLSTHKQCSKRVPRDCTPDLRLIKRIYSVDLTTLARAHGVNTSIVVERCVEEIESRGLEVEGLYRIPGMQDDVELIRQRFDKDGMVARIGSKEFPDINAISGAMKLYLRELPIPLVPFKMYHAFMEATKKQNVHDKVDSFCNALDELYQTFPAHYHTLKLLMAHLVRVTQLHEVNKMNIENLGIVFGPTLMRPPSNQPVIDDLYMLHFQKKSVEIMIEEFDTLFQK
ncbi:beta-chimaerin-like [Lytechinus variegatus]|uniref:beta-chimaerin-like n=1 Tax=Lytechinus variegatus TaxID=7654 RepID=UPI001BB20A1C|nr:beta-chimaerin-like [Lytechinus variegatus]